MERAQLVRALDALPLFPLPEAVLMPGALLPLHVFEPRYRQLVKDLLGNGGPLSVPQMVAGSFDDPFGSPPIHPYASVGVLTAHQALPDGRYNIVIQPVGRVRIEAERHDVPVPYRVARATLLEDELADPAELARIGARVLGAFATAVAHRGPRAAALVEALGAMDAERVPDALAAVVLREAEARQGFLRENRPLVRALQVEEAVLALLAEADGRMVAEA